MAKYSYLVLTPGKKQGALEDGYVRFDEGGGEESSERVVQNSHLLGKAQTRGIPGGIRARESRNPLIRKSARKKRLLDAENQGNRKSNRLYKTVGKGQSWSQGVRVAQNM